ncbi:MAG: hypothetical protein WC291_08280 [Thermodesulfovibrionales bacterium]|jgi:hypothetical protein
MSFTTVLSNLATTLQNNAALASFCTTKWGKALTVKRVYHKRTEINISDLPILLITRPMMDKKFYIGARDGHHTVRLYLGFRQEDREKAQAELVEAEELVDDAMMAVIPSSLGALNLVPQGSQNDEGEYHPVYFTVMDVMIHHRR